MSGLQVALGLSIVAVTVVDIAWTTIAAGSGAGPITSRWAALLWRCAIAVHRRWPSHAFLSVAGVLIVFAVLLTWIALALFGWALVFTASTGAVVAAQTGVPADLVERLYFTGFTVFTLGSGEFVPAHGAWQFATIAATGSGLMLVTLAVTYLVPVAAAVAERRQTASYISSMGNSPHEILTNAWNGEGFSSLDDLLSPLVQQVNAAGQQHLTYPILHYFHGAEPQNATAVNLVNLSDAVELLRFGVAPAARPSLAILATLDRSIDRLVDMIANAHLDSGHEPLPPPSLMPLRDAGIPTVGDDEFRAAVETEGRLRSVLAALLYDDGWEVPGPTRGKGAP